MENRLCFHLQYTPVNLQKIVGLSMMCYTFGKAERTCKGERQARGLIGKLLY